MDKVADGGLNCFDLEESPTEAAMGRNSVWLYPISNEATLVFTLRDDVEATEVVANLPLRHLETFPRGGKECYTKVRRNPGVYDITREESALNWPTFHGCPFR